MSSSTVFDGVVFTQNDGPAFSAKMDSPQVIMVVGAKCRTNSHDPAYAPYVASRVRFARLHEAQPALDSPTGAIVFVPQFVIRAMHARCRVFTAIAPSIIQNEKTSCRQIATVRTIIYRDFLMQSVSYVPRPQIA